MNLTTDKSSGESNASAQTVTILSTTEASTSIVQTLGTIVVYRNGNTSDSQKKTITVKKGQAPVAGSKYYVKTNSITPGKYLFVSDGKTVSSLGDYMNLSTVTISDDKILSDASTDSHAFTITEVTSGKYSICYDKMYVGWNTSTKFKTQNDAPTSSESYYLWTIDGTKLTNVQSSRIIAANAKSDPASLRPYASSNVPGTNPLPEFYKLED